MSGHVTPSLPAVERSVLGAILREPALFEFAATRGIGEDSFFNAIHREIWSAMTKASSAGEPLEILSLSAYAAERIADMAEMESAISTTAFFTQWVSKLKKVEGARRLVASCREIETKLSENCPVVEVLDAAEENLLAARQIAGGSEDKSLIEVASQLRKSLEAPKPVLPLFPIGSEAGALVQLHLGELMVIGARTGSGKTALCAQMAYHALTKGCKVMYVCVESSSEEILARIVSAASGVLHYRRASCECTEHERLDFDAKFLEITSKYRDTLNIIGCDRKVITAESIIRSLRRWALKTGRVDLVVVDFLQGISFARKSGDHRTRLEKLDDSIMMLHDAFAEINCAGILISQFNREMQKKDGSPIPDLTWLKDTSSLEQLAHTVAFLYRQEEDDKVTLFYSRKTRNQASFRLGLTWCGAGYSSQSRF